MCWHLDDHVQNTRGYYVAPCGMAASIMSFNLWWYWAEKRLSPDTPEQTLWVCKGRFERARNERLAIGLVNVFFLVFYQYLALCRQKFISKYSNRWPHEDGLMVAQDAEMMESAGAGLEQTTYTRCCNTRAWLTLQNYISMRLGDLGRDEGILPAKMDRATRLTFITMITMMYRGRNDLVIEVHFWIICDYLDVGSSDWWCSVLLLMTVLVNVRDEVWKILLCAGEGYNGLDHTVRQWVGKCISFQTWLFWVAMLDFRGVSIFLDFFGSDHFVHPCLLHLFSNGGQRRVLVAHDGFQGTGFAQKHLRFQRGLPIQGSE